MHSAEDKLYGKPHPAVFLTTAAELDATPPRQCLVWEDAPAGVLAAEAASMACIAVPEHGEGHHPAFPRWPTSSWTRCSRSTPPRWTRSSRLERLDEADPARSPGLGTEVPRP